MTELKKLFSSKPSPHGYQCILCYEKFHMIPALDIHLKHKHSPIIDSAVSPDILMNISQVPIEKSTYDALCLKDIFTALSDTIAKIQDENTQLQGENKRLKDVNTQLQDENKQLRDKNDQIINDPSSISLTHESMQNKGLHERFSITSKTGTKNEFITNAKKSYFKCIYCKRTVHSIQGCIRHGCCGDTSKCSVCNERFHRKIDYYKHLTIKSKYIKVVRVNPGILDVIRFNIKPITVDVFNKIKKVNCYREIWKTIFKMKKNKCIKKDKFNRYLYHIGCDKWKTIELKTLKIRILYSLSRLLVNYQPTFFKPIIEKIEMNYTKETGIADLIKEYYKYISGWWIIPNDTEDEEVIDDTSTDEDEEEIEEEEEKEDVKPSTNTPRRKREKPTPYYIHLINYLKTGEFVR